jgi:hypothetical protein
LDPKICPEILKTGKNINNKYMFPSEFPYLTEIRKPIKGGKRSTKKNKKSKKNKYSRKN